jgi:glycosyltransferase involved in cell wall biosynthesis
VNDVAPLVSVVIPYHSHGRHLHQAVSSAVRAYSGPKEVIVVNDGSREPRASTFLKDACAISAEVRIVHRENGGLSFARNVGIAEANGSFVQLLDSDDMLVPGKIDLQIAHFQMQPRLDISVTNYLTCDEDAGQFQRDGDSIGRFSFHLSEFLYRWERGFSVPIHCALFRQHVFERIKFDTTVTGKEDWIFWTQQAHDGRRFGYLPVNGAIYRQHPHGMSKSFRAMGDNLLIAAERIRETTECQDPRLIVETQEWHQTFYGPRILAEDRVQQNFPVAAAEASSAVAADGKGTAWIESLVQRSVSASDSPALTVIVPIHNHYQHLPACLASIASQTDAAGPEIILVDDCSSDPRVRPMLQTFARALPSVKLLLHDQNLGISVAQNSAVAIAKGEYIAFVDCDDLLEQDALALVAEAIKPGADYLFTDRVDVNERGETVRVAQYGGYPWLQPSGDIRGDLLDGMVASHLKVIRREMYTRVGGCDPQISGIQDWELALKIADADGRFLHIPKTLYRHRLHSDSVTASQGPRQFWLSNKVRRRFANRWLGRPMTDAESLRRAAAACLGVTTGQRLDDVLLITDFRVPDTLMKLKQAWQAGNVCIYVPPPQTPILELSLAREYNSYFDGILAGDEAVACFFLGYMWDHAALHFVGEASMIHT